MKITLAHVGSRNPAWLEDLGKSYDKKLKHLVQFERQWIRSTESSRDEKAIEKALPESSHIIVFSEEGKVFTSSEHFSEELLKICAQQPSKVFMLIGGAYGVPEAVKQKSRSTWSLSRLTLNHHLAQAVAMEQIYRALTIWKGEPYHNA